MAALPVAAIMFLTSMSGIQTDIQQFSDDVTVEMLSNATQKGKSFLLLLTTNRGNEMESSKCQRK